MLLRKRSEPHKVRYYLERRDPEFNAKMASLGIEPTGLLSEEADRTTREEMDRWKGIIANLSDVKFE